MMAFTASSTRPAASSSRTPPPPAVRLPQGRGCRAAARGPSPAAPSHAGALGVGGAGRGRAGGPAGSPPAAGGADVAGAGGRGPGAEVVCYGEALYDLLADDLGVSRGEVKSWTPYPGGAPCNVATALGRLGTPAAFIGTLGDDPGGKALLELIAGRDVDVSAARASTLPTREVFVTRSADGDRAFAGFALPSSAYSDCAAYEPSSLVGAEAKAREARILVMGTLGLAYPGSRATMLALMDAAKAAGVPVLIDVNWRPMFWECSEEEALAQMRPFVARADVVKITDEEALALLGIDPGAALEDPRLVKDACSGAMGVLVTGGERGSSYCLGPDGHTGFHAAFTVDIADTTGAGDAFTAGFLHAALGGAGGLEGVCGDAGAAEEAARFAAACGALACTRPGAIDSQPTAEEVRAFLAKN